MKGFEDDLSYRDMSVRERLANGEIMKTWSVLARSSMMSFAVQAQSERVNARRALINSATTSTTSSRTGPIQSDVALTEVIKAIQGPVSMNHAQSVEGEAARTERKQDPLEVNTGARNESLGVLGRSLSGRNSES